MTYDSDPEGAPRVDPVELMAQLDLGDITVLHGMLGGGWQKVADQERMGRRRSLERLRTFVPDEIEMPEFVAEDVDAYLASARRVNNTNRLMAESEQLHPEKAAIRDMARAYILRPETLRRLRTAATSGYGDVARTTESFAANLSQLTVTARFVATRNFQARRNTLLRRHFAGAQLMNAYEFWEHIQTQPVTGEHIERARQAVVALPYKAPYPDFFRLSDSDQQVIVEAVGREWEELYTLLHTHGTELLRRESTFGASPLAYLPVRELRDAITENPRVSGHKLCVAFLRNPQRFSTRVEELKQEVQQHEERHRTLLESGLTRTNAVRTNEGILTRNQHEIGKLLADPEVTAEVANMPFGTTIALTPPTTETSGPQLIYRPQLDSIIDKNLQLLGRSLYEGLPGHNARGVTLPRWEGFDVGEALRAGFAGAMSDLTMTRLPVSQAEFEARLPKPKAGQPETTLRAEDVSEVVFTVHMRSSGRQAGPAMLRLMLVVKTGTPRDNIAKAGWWKPRSTGADLVASLRDEASRVARLLEAHHRRNPISGGAPGLGKRQHLR